MSGQFEHDPSGGGKQVSSFPSANGATMHTYGIGQILLGQATAGAKRFEQRAKELQIAGFMAFV